MAENSETKSSEEEKPNIVTVSSWYDVHPTSTIKKLPENKERKRRPKNVSFSSEPQYFEVRSSEPVSEISTRRVRKTSVPVGYYELVRPENSEGQERIGPSILKKPCVIDKTYQSESATYTVSRKWEKIGDGNANHPVIETRVVYRQIYLEEGILLRNVSVCAYCTILCQYLYSVKLVSFV